MLLNKKIVVGSLLIFIPFSSFAEFGEKVCKDVTTNTNIYGGWAECQTEYVNTTCKATHNGHVITTTEVPVNISRDVEETSKQRILLSKLITYTYQTGAGPGMCKLPEYSQKWVHCEAELDFIKTVPVTNRECKYKPVSSISSSPHEYWATHINVRGQDFDGNITSTELWIDGVKQGQAYNDTSRNYRLVNSSSPFVVRVKVTDDDGYTHEQSKTITPVHRGPIMCGNSPC